jgi:non-specific serine/threonine protein kinase
LASPSECKEGIRLCEEGLGLFRGKGDRTGITLALNALGELARLDGDYERAGTAYQEAIDIAHEEGNTMYAAIALSNLSYVAYHQGDYEQAAAIIREVIARLLELENTRHLPHDLALMAGPVAAQGNPQKAARLLGASEALLEAMGLCLQAGDQFEIERYVAAAREQLDRATFEAAWSEGRAMSLEEAVAYALGEGSN